MKPIAILGCGPSAMLAAHAVGLAGRPIAMFSNNPSPSKLGGAQFLHSNIPQLTSAEPDAVIKYVVRGDARMYQRKVYGDTDPGFVSFSGVQDGMEQNAWNLIALYDRLWDYWKDSINDVEVNPKWIDEMLGTFDLIVSTIPAMCMCRNPMGVNGPKNPDAPIHHFSNVETQIWNDTVESVPDNTIIYEGTNMRTWHRSSNLFGVRGTEWGPDVPVPQPNIVHVRKPLATTCDCFPGVLRVGRFGTWTKGKLVNDSFFETLAAIRMRYS